MAQNRILLYENKNSISRIVFSIIGLFLMLSMFFVLLVLISTADITEEYTDFIKYLSISLILIMGLFISLGVYVHIRNQKIMIFNDRLEFKYGGLVNRRLISLKRNDIQKIDKTVTGLPYRPYFGLTTKDKQIFEMKRNFIMDNDEPRNSIMKWWRSKKNNGTDGD